MASRLFQPFLLVLLFIFSTTTITHANRNTPTAKVSNPFGFINQLKGSHKDNNTKGIHQLKAYLKQFGYLEYLNQTHANDDDFDETLESAVKTYQQNYHINPTGTLDDATISKMTTPRCGVPDIINGTNYMQPRDDMHVHGSSHIHTVSHFSFFPGNPRWPDSKTFLTYRFLPGFPTNYMAPVVSAFQKWDAATHFSFAGVQSTQNSDLVIGFNSRDHGDGVPFDGRGGTLAHAFAPTNGRFHYDADEIWSVEATANSFHLESVAIHEIGHLLGLGHSTVQSAIMFSGIGAGQVKNLQADDIQGIKTLYNR